MNNKKELQMVKLREAYEKYCLAEFADYDCTEAQNILGLMYTQVNDDAVDVQVDYNIDKEQLITKIIFGDNEYSFTERHPLADMLTDLKYSNWNSWYSYAHDVCDQRFSLDLEW